jgi:hypothetical protein
MQKRNQWVWNTKSKAVKHFMREMQLQDIAPQSIKTALSGSSYILSDVTRGNGVQTYNMKKELIMVQP